MTLIIAFTTNFDIKSDKKVMDKFMNGYLI